MSYIAELDLVLLTFRERETAVAVHGPRESPTEFTVGLGGFDLDGNGVFSEIVTDPVQTAGGGRFGHGGQMLSVDIAIPGDRIIEVGPLLRTEPNAAFEAGLRSCG